HTSGWCGSEFPEASFPSPDWRNSWSGGWHRPADNPRQTECVERSTETGLRDGVSLKPRPAVGRAWRYLSWRVLLVVAKLALGGDELPMLRADTQDVQWSYFIYR